MSSILVKTQGTSGTISFQNKEYPCVIGRGGTIDPNQKCEGDGATPLGTYALRELWYREDRVRKPECVLTPHIITPEDGWCDDSSSENYNHPIRLPTTEHHENLWLENDTYNLIVPLGYNDEYPIPGKGSAIFLHVARPAFTPTDGCVAMRQEDLLEILARVDKDTQIVIM
jgi:L,D-peptidoglycan transpeptidase YkuD (ErfK/YbiS/YcfS/YnhG family)